MLTIVDSDDEEHPTPSRKATKQSTPLGTGDVLKAKTFDELAQTAFTWLHDIDIYRKKCSNIKGSVHKMFKDRVAWLEELIQCLVDKGGSTGDPVLYKMKLREASGKLKVKEQEENKWKEEKRNLEREVETLYKRVDELELMVHQFSRGKDFDPEEFKKDSKYYLIHIQRLGRH